MASENHATSDAQTDEVKVKRLFDGLTPESKERVTFLITRYHNLTTGDRDAFLQELGLTSAGDVSAQYDRLTMSKMVGTVHPDDSHRVRAVRERDVTYITMNSDAGAPAADSCVTQSNAKEEVSEAKQRIGIMPTDDAVASSLRPVTEPEIREMMVPGLFGECNVSLRPRHESTEGENEACNEQAEDAAAATEGRCDSTDGDAAAAACAAKPSTTKPCIQRSNAYQHFRLTHNLPARLNYEARSTSGSSDHDDGKRVYNVTGVPLYDSELRLWFDELDTEHAGTLDLDQFNNVMAALERDFGVSEEYSDLAKKGAQLSSQGRLSYEAFAYLIMRFVRA